MFPDDNGYAPTPPHIEFLGLSEGALADCDAQSCPLGMTLDQFQSFSTSLKQALERDHISHCDVRLKGSSAHFYSGHHKMMPWDREGIVETFRKLRNRLPAKDEINLIHRTLNEVWPSNKARPLRRPFDAMFKLGIDRYPSDYDIQISADEISQRARERIESLGITVDEFTIHSQTYAFIRKDIIDDVCPMLTRWAVVQSDSLGRGVTIAVFSSEGPPNKEDDPQVGKLSSHFRPTDWVMT